MLIVLLIAILVIAFLPKYGENKKADNAYNAFSYLELLVIVGFAFVSPLYLYFVYALSDYDTTQKIISTFASIASCVIAYLYFKFIK